jgi:hypothetical protein
MKSKSMCDKAEVSESSGAFSGRKRRLRAAVGNLKPVSLLPSQHRILIGLIDWPLSAVCKE